MKNEKRKPVSLLKLFIILGVLFISHSSEAGDKLKIEIRSDKGEFLTHEPIIVHYTVKNVGDSMAYLNFHMIEEDFVIEDEKGQRYRSHIRGTYGGGQLFAPGEIFTKGFDIGGRYGIHEVGEYTCYIHSYPFFSPNATFLNSNTIKLKVVEPKGEEKKALNLYLDAGKARGSEGECCISDSAKKDIAFQKYLDLVDKYPNSIYAPKALRAAYLMYLYSRNPIERRRVVPVCTKLIEDYPDSYYFMWAFTSLVGYFESLKDKEGAKKAMQYLIDKHPNTNISQEAKRRLKMVETWEFK